MGPYFTKKWVLIGSLSQSFGVLISFRDSENGDKYGEYLVKKDDEYVKCR